MPPKYDVAWVCPMCSWPLGSGSMPQSQAYSSLQKHGKVDHREINPDRFISSASTSKTARTVIGRIIPGKSFMFTDTAGPILPVRLLQLRPVRPAPKRVAPVLKRKKRAATIWCPECEESVPVKLMQTHRSGCTGLFRTNSAKARRPPSAPSTRPAVPVPAVIGVKPVSVKKLVVKKSRQRVPAVRL
jgi:hypothetical protein